MIDTTYTKALDMVHFPNAVRFSFTKVDKQGRLFPSLREAVLSWIDDHLDCEPIWSIVGDCAPFYVRAYSSEDELVGLVWLESDEAVELAEDLAPKYFNPYW